MNEQDNPWKILSERPVYDNAWIQVTHYDVINPSGGNGIYGKIHFKNIAVGIVPMDEAMNTWLVGQYRFTINQYSWEIPEGGGIIGTDPLEAAKRELIEETGFTAKTWTKIAQLYLSNSVTDEYCVIYLARDLTPGVSSPEETESLSTKKIPFDMVYGMVSNGEITDAITIVAIQKVKLLLLEGKLH